MSRSQEDISCHNAPVENASWGLERMGGFHLSSLIVPGAACACRDDRARLNALEGIGRPQRRAGLENGSPVA